MEMLLSSYKAYLWPNGQLNKSNCRISTLHFAREVQKSISAAITCLESIHNHEYLFSEFEKTILKERYAGLQVYTSEQRFGLYYQAPWTSGCHMVEILHLAICEGLHLCCGSGYVCALLHLYNALRQLDPQMARIKLLDQLCQVFSDALFLGTLPTENFSSHFRRAMGGLLNPKSNAGSNGRISKPATSTSTRRVAPAKVSMFYDLHNSCYQTTSDFWVQVYIDKNIRRPTKSQYRVAVDQVHSAPFNVPLDKIKAAVLPEFNGDLPVARINYFSIYIFCTQLIEEVGTAINGPAGSAVGFELVDILLEEIVEHLRDDPKRHLLPYFRPLKLAKGVFSKLDGSMSLSQHLWAI